MDILIVVLAVAVVVLCLMIRHRYRAQKCREFLALRDEFQRKLTILEQALTTYYPGAGVSSKTIEKIHGYQDAVKVFDRFTPESKGVNWRMEMKNLRLVGDSIAVYARDVISQIHFALEADARGPSLMVELPLMLDAADNYLANSLPHHLTPLMMISLKHARQTYEHVRRDAATAPEQNWLVLYPRMVAVELVCVLVMQADATTVPIIITRS
jgi:hypothetical protein